MRKVVAAAILPVLPDKPPGPYAQRLRSAALAAASALEAAEPLLTDLDSKAGDGDLGLSMTRGAEAIRVTRPGFLAGIRALGLPIPEDIPLRGGERRPAH
jgi:hypothetical protein